MLQQGHVLALPGAFFSPDETRLGHTHLRVAFANIDGETIETFVDRMIDVGIRLAPAENPLKNTGKIETPLRIATRGTTCRRKDRTAEIPNMDHDGLCHGGPAGIWRSQF